MPTFWNRSIAARVSLAGCLGLLAVLLALTAGLSVLSTQGARADRARWLADDAQGVVRALDAVDVTARGMVDRVFPVFTDAVGHAFALAPDGGLVVDGHALAGDTTAVDRFHDQTGGVATIFVRQGVQFRRIATSVKKQDGSRAVGTTLDPAGAAYASVLRGEAYGGRARLFDKTYMTRYEPVRDGSGQVVGVLFVGFEIEAFESALETLVARTRFFDTGGISLVDPRGGWDEAVFAMHPRWQGRRLADVVPGAREAFEALRAADPAAPAPAPVWHASLLQAEPAGDPRWAVARRSEATRLLVVAEVSDAEAMHDQRTTLAVLWAVLGATCLVLGLGLGVMLRRSVGRPLGRLAALARAVAGGDLTTSCATTRADEIGRLMNDIEAMRRRFLDLLLAVRQSADSIATASGEIAQGNLDLSGRTEHAASNLQRTAGSMDAITSTVRQTAEAARSASDLATLASRTAQEGGEAMARVVSTMDTLHGSAARISEISSVIDGIAFQTNILALNAAVEAARAGEQGRGFAVVATEVRTLAQRSAAAAREIGGLIESSVNQVADGTRLVRAAGTTMQDIVHHVGSVSGLVVDIAGSSRRQSDGLSQVNDSVGELDRMTQQNAALVEQSAAAAASLEEQATRLAQLLRGFRLDEAPAA